MSDHAIPGLPGLGGLRLDGRSPRPAVDLGEPVDFDVDSFAVQPAAPVAPVVAADGTANATSVATSPGLTPDPERGPRRDNRFKNPERAGDQADPGARERSVLNEGIRAFDGSDTAAPQPRGDVRLPEPTSRLLHERTSVDAPGGIDIAGLNRIPGVAPLRADVTVPGGFVIPAAPATPAGDKPAVATAPASVPSTAGTPGIPGGFGGTISELR